MDKIKYDIDWYQGSISYKPLQLLALIDKTILAQTEDQYPFSTVNEQECSVYSFSHKILSNKQCYEWLNTNIDVGSDILVTRKHQAILSNVAEESNNKNK